MSKPQPAKTPEELYNEATDDTTLSSGDLHLLTAGLAALRATNDKPVNKIEMQAIYGMIAYVAHDQNVGEEIVIEIMTSHFGVDSVAGLPARLYQNAIEYLVDLKISNILN